MAGTEAAAQPSGGAEALASAQQPENQGSDTGAENQQQAEGQGDEGNQPSGDEGQRQPEGSNKTPGWAQRRIDELTAKRHESERRAEEAERRAREATEALTVLLQGQQPAQGEGDPQQQQPQFRAPAQPQPQQPAVPLTQEQIQQEAARIVAKQQFDAACNDAFAKGKSEFQNFEDSVRTLAAAGVIDPQNPGFVEALLETEAPQKLIHHFGQDPEEAMRIASLPPRRQAIELDRLAQKLSKPAPKPVSKAPEPITPVNGSGGDDSGPSDNDNMEVWAKKRQAQREARRAAGRR